MGTFLRAGDPAPAFSGTDQDGRTISLEDFRGRRLILYFYPRDNTPSCTTEACNLRDHYALLTARGFAVVGVSADSGRSHKKFEQRFKLPFPLISDEDMTIIRAYGVYGEKQFMGRRFMGILRTTFVIDGGGTIAAVIERPRNRRHAEQILEVLGEAP